jgi:type II secretory pathway predicted ATPase ExeA
MNVEENVNNRKKLLALFGLKWNPFLSDIPAGELWHTPGIDNFCFRVENLVMDGGFALISGDPGQGKSKVLQLLAHRLDGLNEIVVGIMERPQSSLSDLYRELGTLFGVNLRLANRYGGFKALRERWRDHIKNTLMRPVLLVDEAQEMQTACLNEIRLLGSAVFDSQCLLATVLCGDMRLAERFRMPELMSMGSRIRVRLILEPYDRKSLISYMKHSLEKAGASHLMTEGLIETLTDHCAGNLRILNNLSSELLEVGAQKEVTQLDVKLYLEVFSTNRTSTKKRY